MQQPTCIASPLQKLGLPPPPRPARTCLAERVQIDVKVIGLNDKGKVRLSRRAVLMDARGKGAGGGRPATATAGTGLGVIKASPTSAADVKADAAPVSALIDVPVAGGSDGGSKGA